MRYASCTCSLLGLLCWWLAAARPASAFDGCQAADVNGDGTVTWEDVEEVGIWMGQSSERADLDGDGIVGTADQVIASRFFELYQNLEFRNLLCPVCPADLACSGEVDLEDRGSLERAFGRDCSPDLNRDGYICPKDIRLLNEYLGAVGLSLAAKRADLDGDGEVDAQDRQLIQERINLGPFAMERDCRPDLNRDGAVDTVDLRVLLASWGPCSEPCPFPKDSGFESPSVVGPELARTCDEGKPGETQGDPGAF